MPVPHTPTPICRFARCARGLLAAALCGGALLAALPVSAAVQTGGQQGCINAANGAARKLATVVGKEASRCVKKAGQGKEPDAAACLESSARVAAARAGLAAASARACAEVPDFGFTGAATAGVAVEEEGHALVASLFGADPQAAMAVGDEAGARCQAAATAGAGSLLGQAWKAATATKKEALRSAADAGPLGDAVAVGVAGDGGVARKTGALTRKLGRSCGGASAAALFPGACTGAADAPALAACVAARARCAFCRGFNGSDGTAIDCDVFDDALANGSCEAAPRCGDGALDSGETCDDGNLQAGDGCSASCQFEAVCGDGVTGPGESCDDGDTEDGDGCSASCRLESCGDGALDAGEECDDGDTEAFDGCSAGCLLEVVFVSAGGEDTAPGTRAAPKATLQAGVDAAQLQGYGDVHVAAGNYFPAETIALRNGVSVTGGFDPASWAPGAGTTQIFGPSEVLYVQGFNVPTTLEGLALQAAAAASGDSSYGIRMVTSILLTIRGFTIVAGSGADGDDGYTPPGPGGNGPPGGDGGDGAADGTVRGAAGAASSPYTCVFGGRGGMGGAAGVHPGDAGANGHGLTCYGAGPGGAGGPGSAGTFGVAAQPGTDGADGVPGASGAPGAGGDGGGRGGSSWRGSDGSPGEFGASGSGGGGGGGGGGNFDFSIAPPQDRPDTGAGGGGGGSGGEYGQRGYAGEAGTGSFGVYLYRSSVTVEDSIISTGPGGAGGEGGFGRPGGLGGAGGEGGLGAEGSGAGGRGGKGGDGGRGGNGGGGSGGVSFPILVGEDSALTESGNTLAPGPGGPGGGPNGSDGDAGPIGAYPPLSAAAAPSALTRRSRP